MLRLAGMISAVRAAARSASAYPEADLRAERRAVSASGGLHQMSSTILLVPIFGIIKFLVDIALPTC